MHGTGAAHYVHCSYQRYSTTQCNLNYRIHDVTCEDSDQCPSLLTSLSHKLLVCPICWPLNLTDHPVAPNCTTRQHNTKGKVPFGRVYTYHKMVDYEDFTFSRTCSARTGFSVNRRTAYRKDPSSCYDGAVALSHRPLRRREFFEIRMDSLREDKWTGSLAIGTLFCILHSTKS